MLIGYARISTPEQSLDPQVDALKAAGCEKIFSDVASGARTERIGLDKAIDYCRKDDILVVWKLDRMGRSLPHLLATVGKLKEEGIGFKSLTEDINTVSPAGKLIFHIFGALAEFERDLIRERVKSGLKAARARGVKGGRPPVPEQTKLMAKILLKDKSLSVKEICNRLGIARSTLYKHGKS